MVEFSDIVQGPPPSAMSGWLPLLAACLASWLPGRLLCRLPACCLCWLLCQWLHATLCTWLPGSHPCSFVLTLSPSRPWPPGALPSCCS